MTIFLAISVVIAIFVIFTYNKLVRLRLFVKEAFSGIDIQLKRRHSLVPNIVETVKGYSQHEKDLLEKVTALRSRLEGPISQKELQQTENEFSRSLRTIFALVEAYPELKANQNFLDLQKNLIEIEDQLQMARRYYNGTVRNYNTMVESFPPNLVAALFHFQREDFFEIEYATERQTPEVNFHA